jgi:CHAD domain-containing protein
MLVPECFWNYYKGQQQRIKRDFGRAIKHFEIEGVHDLRVDIKRLRAYFKLIEAINPVFQAKPHLRRIRRLFKNAGPLRDVQVQQQVVQNWSQELNLELSEYYNYLKEKEFKARKDFYVSSHKFSFDIFKSNWAKIRHSLMYISPEYIQFKAEGRFNKLVEDVISYKNKQDFVEDDYHDIRILSKEARYTLEIIQNCYPAQDHWEQLNNSLRTLHQALGKWHDADIALMFLDGFMLEYTQPSFFNKESYLQYIKALQTQKQKMLGLFEKNWKGFIALINSETIPTTKEQKSGQG